MAEVKKRGRPKQTPPPNPQEERYPKVCLLKTKARKALDAFHYDRIQHKEYLYLIERKDGQCLLCPGPSPASYLATWVPEDCIKPYKPKRIDAGQSGS